MKKIVCLLILFIFAVHINAQNDDLKKSINDCLTSFIEAKKRHQDKGIIKQDYFDNLYISIDNFPPHYSFKKSILDIPVKYISITCHMGFEKILKKGAWVISLNNINLVSNRLEIIFVLENVTLKGKKNLNIGLSESFKYILDYSCEEDKWIMVSEKHSGV